MVHYWLFTGSMTVHCLWIYGVLEYWPIAFLSLDLWIIGFWFFDFLEFWFSGSAVSGSADVQTDSLFSICIDITVILDALWNFGDFLPTIPCYCSLCFNFVE